MTCGWSMPTMINGLTLPAAEKKIADALQSGGFVRQPQVNIVLRQVREAQPRADGDGQGEGCGRRGERGAVDNGE